MNDQQLLPFDLKKALAGWLVVTRDGRPVKIAGYNADAAGMYPIIGWADNVQSSWDLNGKHATGRKDLNDLFMATQPAGTEVKEGYLNIYAGDKTHLYDTKEAADNGACQVLRKACIPVAWIEYNQPAAI